MRMAIRSEKRPSSVFYNPINDVAFKKIFLNNNNNNNDNNNNNIYFNTNDIKLES